jgi:adenylate kinase
MVVAGRGIPFGAPHPGRTNMIVFLSGLSGAGKTTMARAITMRHPQFKHVIASDIIRNAGADTKPTNARAVEQNQIAILKRFEGIRQQLAGYSILFDGHMVIETADGPQIIRDQVIDALEITHFCVILDDPKRIQSTRYRSQKAKKSIAQLADLQTLELNLTRRQAERTDRPFAEIRRGDLDTFERSLGIKS